MKASLNANRTRLRLALLLASYVTSITCAVRADVLPPPLDYVPPPPKQTLQVELQSRLDGSDWIERKRSMPARQREWFTPLVEKMATTSGECVVVMLHFFEDGSMRTTGQLLDEHCLFALTDWQELKTNGGASHFNAQTARGAVEVRLSARWMNPPSQGLSKLTRAELAEVPELSSEQLAVQARQRTELARVMKNDNVDRAWRAARRQQ